MSATGKARISEKVFKTQLGISSGPLERDVLISRSFLATIHSLTNTGTSLSFTDTAISSDMEYSFASHL